MYFLSLDTSLTQSGSVAVVKENPDHVLEEIRLPAERSQSETLLTCVAELFTRHKIAVNQLSGIVAAVGPGSFTGIRIGLATAQGLSAAAEIPLYGVSTLAGLACNALKWAAVNTNRLVCSVLDARKNEIYGGFFKYENHGMEPMVEECHALPEELMKQAEEFLQAGKEILFLGEGTGLLPAINHKAVQIAEPSMAESHAANLVRIAWPDILSENATPNAELLPRYLRPESREFKKPQD